jgi:hypothetical protein
MNDPSWTSLIVLVLINLAGLWLGLTTRIGSPNDDPRAIMLRRMARNTGLIIGIGGWIPATLLLLDLLRDGQ